LICILLKSPCFQSTKSKSKLASNQLFSLRRLDLILGDANPLRQTVSVFVLATRKPLRCRTSITWAIPSLDRGSIWTLQGGMGAGRLGPVVM
jgi:hypothetical protein